MVRRVMRRPIAPGFILPVLRFFLKDVARIGQAKQEICARAGLRGVFPMDTSLCLDGLEDTEKARQIARADELLMDSCVAIIANVTPFRGTSADVGTAFEMGYMRAQGKPVFAYTNVAADYVDRVKAHRLGLGEQAFTQNFDASDVAIEDFGLAENLMLEMAVVAGGNALVRQRVGQHQVNSELTAFRICVEQAAGVLAG